MFLYKSFIAVCDSIHTKKLSYTEGEGLLSRLLKCCCLISLLESSRKLGQNMQIGSDMGDLRSMFVLCQIGLLKWIRQNVAKGKDIIILF